MHAGLRIPGRARRRHSPRVIVGLAVLVGLSACVGQASTTSTSHTVVAPTTARLQPDGMVPLLDHVTGLTGLRPDGWREVGYGTFITGEGDSFAVFQTQFFPAATARDAVDEAKNVIGGLPITETGTVETDRFTYRTYEYESAGGVFDGTLARGRLALAEADGGVYLVSLAIGSAYPETAWGDIFEPALEWLGPWGSTDAAEDVASDAPYRDQSLDPAVRAADLLAHMTLREKLGQMTLIEKNSLPRGSVAVYALGAVLSGGGGSPARNTPETWADMVRGFQEEALGTRLGVPIIYGVDAVHGHASVLGATVFPHNIGLGAAGDPALVERIARATALETAATGIRWNFAPVLAIASDVRWGRTYEAYGQDPDLVASLGAAYVRGLQGETLSDPTAVLATPKHFVGDGSTVYGSSQTGDYLLDQGVTPADDRLLTEILLPPYVAAVEAGARSVMGSFSSWGDVKVHAQRELLVDVLRGQAGFGGFVVSDWGAIDQISDDYYEAVVTAINAGVDMNMVPHDPVSFMWTMSRALDEGAISIDRIDEAVTRILEIKFSLGLFEQPHPDPGLLDEVGSDEHRQLAREAVARSAVLLENDDLLPLAGEPQVILVGGIAADDLGIQAGGWTLTWQGRPGDIAGGTSILEGIKTRAPAGSTVVYSRDGRLTGANEGIAADVCVAVIGEAPYAEGVGDSTDLTMPDAGLVETMSEVCDQLVVIIVSGRPVIITDEIADWDAVVAAWLPGTEGAGIADVLFGDVAFTGTLPVAWPVSIDQLPLGSSEEEPLFPIGFGLTG